MKKKDKYRWEDANICMRCESLELLSKGNRLKYFVCGECVKELKQRLKDYKKYGLYATIRRS